MSDVEPPPALINPETGQPVWVPSQRGTAPQAEQSGDIQPWDRFENQTEGDSDFENSDTDYASEDSEDQTEPLSPASSDTRTDTAEKKTVAPSRGALARGSSDNQTKTASKKKKFPAPLKPAGNNDAALKKYARIIDKNLFSPERKKWMLPAARGKQANSAIAKKTLDKLVLFGTIISPQGRYAVLRTKKTSRSRKSKQAAESFQPYTLGDYIAGYRIKEIDAKKVTLIDESENQEYTVFFNADQQVRRVEKTARKRATPKPAVKPAKRRRPVKRRLPKKPPTIPAPPARAWGR